MLPEVVAEKSIPPAEAPAFRGVAINRTPRVPDAGPSWPPRASGEIFFSIFLAAVGGGRFPGSNYPTGHPRAVMFVGLLRREGNARVGRVARASELGACAVECAARRPWLEHKA